MQAWRRVNLEAAEGKEAGKGPPPPPVALAPGPAPPAPPPPPGSLPPRASPRINLCARLTADPSETEFAFSPLRSFLLAKQKRSRRALTPDLPAQGGPLWKTSRPCVGRRALRGCANGCAGGGRRASARWRPRLAVPSSRPCTRSRPCAQPCTRPHLPQALLCLGTRGRGRVPLPTQQLLVPPDLRTAHV